MIRQDFNHQWKCFIGSASFLEKLQLAQSDAATITLPHDAMVHEPRDPNTANGAQTGFYPGGNFEYVKTFDVPADWQDKTVIVEFEGVYQTAMVYLNDCLVETNYYGYSNFYVTLDRYLEYGKPNTLKVIADNACEKNSRWYSGSGIYRNVKLLLGSHVHVPADGLRICTYDISRDSAMIEVETQIRNIARTKEKLDIRLEIRQAGQQVYEAKTVVTVFAQTDDKIRQRFCLQQPKLWDCDDPALYQCHLSLYAGEQLLDEVWETFGIRKLEIDAFHGLRINGKQVKLRGTCIHHDNGIVGAATFEAAEDRKCRLLKQAGFNSIRSAHHPASKALLEACDRNGMLVMDELYDMWTNHKNIHDNALYFADTWQEEAARMVAKDYNHPCVILYSIGNENFELGTDRGKELNRILANKLHELDPERYVTNGIHGLTSVPDKMEEIIRDIQQTMQSQKENDLHAASKEELESGEGSSVLNSYTDILTGETGRLFACHPLVDAGVEELIQPVDVIGYNYFAGRHTHEIRCHPQKTVLGTESYPSELVHIWRDAKRYDHILGDFTWTGYDYLGEAGAGIFYYDGRANFSSFYPDRLACVGDIDLVGYRKPISYLREMAFGLRKTPYIAVERVDRYGMPHSKNPWMTKDNVASWTWPGYEGKPAVVDVYADAEEVELFCNGRSLGRKSAGEDRDYTATFETTYEAGELVAVSYDRGAETGRCVLKTAAEAVELAAEADRTTLRSNAQDLAFITVKLVDADGTENLFAKKRVTVNVAGAGTLQGFGNADPQSVGSYDDVTWETYNGYLLAAIRSGNAPGQIRVTFSAEGCKEKTVILNVAE